MNIDQTEMIAIVDPDQLESAYCYCAHLFVESRPGGAINAEGVLDYLGRAFPNLEPCDQIDLFRRLCLTVQLVSEVDVNWEFVDIQGERPNPLPPAFFELTGTELAFEGIADGRASSFFARDLFQDALISVRS